MLLRTPASFTLLGRFTVASALIAAGFALALGWLVSDEVASAALDEAVAATAQAADSLLSPYLVKGDFTYPLWPARLDDLNRMISRHLSDRDIVRVSLWSRDGVVIYSSDGALVGRKAAPSDQLRAAMDSRVSAQLRQRDMAGNGRGPAGGPVLDVYVPVRLIGMTQPEGVYEVSRDASALMAHIRAARLRVWLLVFVGTAVLYGALFGLVRRASTTLVEQQRNLQAAFEGTIQALATAVDVKDAYTSSHSSQVSRYAEAIGRAIGLPEADVQAVRLAGYLHDLGKIGIPDRLLGKTGTLEERDWEMIRRHSLIGYSILEPVPIDERVKLAVRYSHERWDGFGYPDGLAGEAIPIHARILMVADAYDAMTSDRPYRRALERAWAMEELRRNAGAQFDPEIVVAFLDWLDSAQAEPSLKPEGTADRHLRPA